MEKTISAERMAAIIDALESLPALKEQGRVFDSPLDLSSFLKNLKADQLVMIETEYTGE